MMKRYKRNIFKEATEIEVKELPSDKLKDYIYFLKVLTQGISVDSKKPIIWEGIHGYILMVVNKGLGSPRFSNTFLKLLLKNKSFRWIEGDNDDISIGF